MFRNKLSRVVCCLIMLGSLSGPLQAAPRQLVASQEQDFGGGSSSPRVTFWCAEQIANRQVTGEVPLYRCGTDLKPDPSCGDSQATLKDASATEHGIYLRIRLADSSAVSRKSLKEFNLSSVRFGGLSLAASGAGISYSSGLLVENGALLAANTNGSSGPSGGTHTYADCQFTFKNLGN